MKRLIVNADDFGYTRGVNRAIVEACRNGVVTSTSLLANGPAFEDAVGIALAERKLDVGCHLNFVEGHPISPPQQVPHLLDSSGRFLKPWQLAVRLLRRAIPEIEIEREASAQIGKLLAAGLRPSHVDTHKHTHVHPAVARAVARAARRYDIRWIRRPFENFPQRSAQRKTHGTKNPSASSGQAVPWLPLSVRKFAVTSLNCLAPAFERRMAAIGMAMPDFFTGVLLTGRLTRQAFAETLAELPSGVTEVMCHPGYCDAELRESPTRLREEREVERETVTDGAWRARTRELRITLTTFGKLSSPEKDPRHEKPFGEPRAGSAVATPAVSATALRE